MRAGYLRISSDVDGARLGVERQRADISALAARKFPGEPVTWYEDNDLSAYTGKVRPAYVQLCADIGSGHVTGLIGYNFDRLWRRPLELESFLDSFVPSHLTHVYTVEGDVDLSTHDGQFHARILVAVAKKSSDDMSRRLRRKFLADAEAGRPHGRAPFGYTRNWDLDPVNASLVRQAYKVILAGGTISAAADILGMNVSHAKRLLLAPRYAGLREHKGKVVGPGTWEPLVTVEDHERAVTLITARSRPTGRRAPRRHPLTGLIRCRDHGLMEGTVMYSHGKPLRIYLCKTEKCWRAIVAERTEALLQPILIQLYSRPHMIEALTSPDETDPTSRAELLVTEAKLSELETRYFIDGTIATNDYMRLHAQLGQIIEHLRNKQGQSVAPWFEDFDTDWSALEPVEKAHVYRYWFHAVTIAAGRRGARFDPSRVTIELSAVGAHLLAQSAQSER